MWGGQRRWDRQAGLEGHVADKFMRLRLHGHTAVPALSPSGAGAQAAWGRSRCTSSFRLRPPKYVQEGLWQFLVRPLAKSAALGRNGLVHHGSGASYQETCEEYLQGTFHSVCTTGHIIDEETKAREAGALARWG